MNKRIETDQYLQATQLVDVDHPLIQQKVKELSQNTTSATEVAKNIYHFVRDKIPYTFTHNLQKASDVLNDQAGQCNTKTTLTVALLRAAGIPARYHCGNVDKTMFQNIIPSWAFPLAPKEIPGHCWPEAFINNKWTAMENIVDLNLYTGIQCKMATENIRESTGCGLSKDNFQEIWDGKTDILMQGGALLKDSGILSNADDYLKKSEHFLNPVKQWLRQKFVKPAMNKKFQKLRDYGKK